MIAISEKTMSLAAALAKPVQVLHFSRRVENGLRRARIGTVADLYTAYTNGTLPMVRNIGLKSIFEIEYELNKYLVNALFGYEEGEDGK